MKKIFVFLIVILVIVSVIGFKYISYKNGYNIIQNENAEFDQYVYHLNRLQYIKNFVKDLPIY